MNERNKYTYLLIEVTNLPFKSKVFTNKGKEYTWQIQAVCIFRLKNIPSKYNSLTQ